MTALTNDFKVRNSSRRSTLAVEEAEGKIPSSDIGLNHDLHTRRTTSEHSSIFPKTWGTTLREKIFLICSLCSGGDYVTIGVIAGSVAFALLLLIAVLVRND